MEVSFNQVSWLPQGSLSRLQTVLITLTCSPGIFSLLKNLREMPIWRSCCAENGSLNGVLEMRGPGMLMSNTSLGEDISPLDLLVESIDPEILHIKISAPGRWEVPKDDIFINTNQSMS